MDSPNPEGMMTDDAVDHYLCFHQTIKNLASPFLPSGKQFFHTTYTAASQTSIRYLPLWRGDPQDSHAIGKEMPTQCHKSFICRSKSFYSWKSIYDHLMCSSGNISYKPPKALSLLNHHCSNDDVSANCSPAHIPQVQGHLTWPRMDQSEPTKVKKLMPGEWTRQWWWLESCSGVPEDPWGRDRDGQSPRRQRKAYQREAPMTHIHY